MAVKFIIFLLTFLVYIFCVQSRIRGPKHDKVVVCHLSPMETKREHNFKLDDVDLSLCTHLVIDNAYINNEDYTISFETDGRDNLVTRETLATVKSQYPHIKITASVVTISQVGGTITESNIPNTQRTRDKYTTNAVAHVRLIIAGGEMTEQMLTCLLAYMLPSFYSDLGIDGLDIFLLTLPKSPEDVEDFLDFMKELKEEFETLDYILTATFMVFDMMVNINNDLLQVTRYVDLLHISTTNFFMYEYNSQVKRMFVPLKNKRDTDKKTVESVIKKFLAKGVGPDKLVLTSALYGKPHRLGLRDMENIPFGDIIATNSSHDVTNYRDICKGLTEKSSIELWYEGFSVPYIPDGEYTVLYENPRSIVNKVKLAMDYDLKGIALLGLHMDDYMGKCKITNDTYSQFIEGYNKINEDPNLLQKLHDLNLPNADSVGDLDRDVSYGVVNNRLYFRVPQLKRGPYPIFRAVNQAITLSLEEKRIRDALKPNKTEPVRRFCLFWPKCATSILAPSPETTS